MKWSEHDVRKWPLKAKYAVKRWHCLCWEMLLSITRVHVNYVISQYRSRIRQPCDIASPRDQIISCMNALLTCVCVARQYRPNTHNSPTCCPFDKQCRTAIIISGTVIWKAQTVKQSVTGRRRALQHMHCLICTLPTQHPRVAGESRCVTLEPWPRRMADLHNVEGMLPVSLRNWSTHLLFGRPGRRFQSRPGRQPSDRSTWPRTAWWAGTSSLSLAIWPKIATRWLAICC